MTTSRRLFQFSYSPYAAKVRIALKLKSLPFEVVNVPYTSRTELVRVTGGLGVPVLVEGDTVIRDSPAILAHVEKSGGPALRDNPLSIVLEQWADEFFEEKAFRWACPGLEDAMGASEGEEARLWFRLIKERRYGAGAISTWREEAQQHRTSTLEALQPIVTALGKSPFVLGERPSIADAAIAGQLFMLEVASPGFVRREVPSLAGWYERLKA